MISSKVLSGAVKDIDSATTRLAAVDLRTIPKGALRDNLKQARENLLDARKAVLRASDVNFL